MMQISLLMQALASTSSGHMKTVCCILSFAFALLASLLAIDSTYVWHYENHYLISYPYVPVFLLSLYFTRDAILQFKAR
jgi:hypothetical protein